MIILDHPRQERFPYGLNFKEKLKYIITGKVSVGKFSKPINGKFVSYYLPRLRQMNFSARLNHPGYKTADQAYTAGHILMLEFKKNYSEQIQPTKNRGKQ